MSDWLRQILESKRAMRKRLAALPFGDKVKLLEQLRDRSAVAQMRGKTVEEL